MQRRRRRKNTVNRWGIGNCISVDFANFTDTGSVQEQHGCSAAGGIIRGRGYRVIPCSRTEETGAKLLLFSRARQVDTDAERVYSERMGCMIGERIERDEREAWC